MNRRWPLLILIGLFLALFGLAFWPMSSNEPSYQGKRLSAWLYDLGMKPGDTNAGAAVRAIGTNAVPHLVRAVMYKPSYPRRLFFDTASRLLYETLHLRKRALDDAAGVRCLGAVRGFGALGPAASNAVAPLCALLDDRQVGELAVLSLSEIGPAALSRLTPALTNASSTVRYYALRGLAVLGPDSRPAQPAVLVVS